MIRLKSLLLGICLSITINASMAQPGDPGGDPDNPVPIGGLEILLIAGGALGINRLVKKKQ